MYKEYGEVINNASLENFNTYGIKTTCDFLVKPNSCDNVLNLIKKLNKNNIKYYVLGKGSNVILPDNNFNGVIISLECLNNIEIDNNIVLVDAGVILSNLVNNCINNGLSGLENLANIPGTLGGAIIGNAGANGSEIYDNLVSVTYIKDEMILTKNKDEIEYSYRNTEFKNSNVIILNAKFKLSYGNIDEMKEIVKENRIKRINTQPLKYKNAGSVFKNPDGYSAGKLIEECNLKGYKIGDAEISFVHANFIINNGNALSQDIRDLIDLIKEKVYEKFNIELELEQIIINW